MNRKPFQGSEGLAGMLARLERSGVDLSGPYPAAFSRMVREGFGDTETPWEVCEWCEGTGEVRFCPSAPDTCDGCEIGPCLECGGAGRVAVKPLPLPASPERVKK